MIKHIVLFIAIFIIGLVTFSSFQTFQPSKNTINENQGLTLPALTLPTLALPNPVDAKLGEEAWTVFQEYLKFAQAHDLEGLTKLSHQISVTCLDPNKQKECFELMDSVYLFGTQLRSTDFTHIVADDKQIAMYTNGPTVAILYFTRTGGIKVLGMRFCFEDKNTAGTCVNPKTIKNDEDGDGWWDTVESIFYK